MDDDGKLVSGLFSGFILTFFLMLAIFAKCDSLQPYLGDSTKLQMVKDGYAKWESDSISGKSVWELVEPNPDIGKKTIDKSK